MRESRRSAGGSTGGVALARLEFREKLVSGNLSRPLGSKEVSSRLERLFSELKTLEQEETELSTLSGVASELLSASLVGSKDGEVRALAACCVAELLRIHAPDAPYADDQLRSVFTLFLKQLQMVADAQAPHAHLHQHLLLSLAAVKSPLLLVGLGADDLIQRLFGLAFDVAGVNPPKAVRAALLDILLALVDELAGLPLSLTELVLRHFTPPATSAQTALAVSLCSGAIDVFQRCVCQYFSDVIIGASHDDHPDADADLRTAHALILALFDAVPQLLLNVVPQLEEELKVLLLSYFFLSPSFRLFCLFLYLGRLLCLDLPLHRSSPLDTIPAFTPELI